MAPQLSHLVCVYGRLCKYACSWARWYCSAQTATEGIIMCEGSQPPSYTHARMDLGLFFAGAALAGISDN